MADHPPIDDLADAAEDLLDPDRTVRVAGHVAGCVTCQDTTAALAQVSQVLAAVPVPTIPPAVDARLTAALAAESEQRSTAAALGHSVPRSHPPRHSLGHFGADLVRPPLWRRFAPLLAAAVVATAVGLGGYALSAVAGLDEPPLLGVALTTADLASQARTLERTDDLDAHRVSPAWVGGRAVTDGRVTGLARARVDGSPALLVYTRSDGSTTVSVVTGCAPTSASALPSVAASAVLAR